MGNQRISGDLKECALRLYDIGWDLHTIKNTLLISISSLYQWHKNFETHGTAIQPCLVSRGPNRIITQAVLTAVRTLYETENDLYLDKLVIWCKTGVLQ